MISRSIYKSSFTIACLLSFLYASAQNNTTVKATIDKSRILIGEQINLKLEADIPESQPIRFFDIDSFPHFEIVNTNKIDTSNTSDGTILSQTILLTSFDSGHWVIPSFILTDNIVTDSLPVDVGFSSFDPQQPYHDIKDIIEVTPEEEKEHQQWWYIAAGALLLLLLILFLIFRKKKKPVIHEVKLPVDPYKEAMAQLEKIRVEKMETKQYYSKLVDVFRVYISAKKGIHSLQKTTDDLVIQLKKLDFDKDQFEKLSQSLRLSDFVKFAKYVPSAEDNNSIFDTIKKSIENIEQIK